MKTQLTLCISGTLTLIGMSGCEKTPERPMNVVYILADDLGYGDVGCYGQQIIKTPNIDRMAKEGMLFTQHYAGCTVSAPSRCSLMTGLHTGHTQVRGNREITPEGQQPMREDTYTLGKLMKSAGYTTGIFGKWGLGNPGSVSIPNKMGFDEFYGYNCQRQSHSFYPDHLWHNEEKVLFPENENNACKTYSQDLIHEQALKFIRDHKEQPFFAMLTYTLPHAELNLPHDSIYKMYENSFEETPYIGKFDKVYGGYNTSEKPLASFAAMVSRLDKYVGDVMAELKELGLDKNTIVIFTSDNGPHHEGGADPDFFKSYGPFRGIKRDVYEGGIRIPMVAWCPGTIKAGTPDYIGSTALAEALRYVDRIGIENIAAYEDELLRYATAGLNTIEGMRIFGQADHKGAVLSFLVGNIHHYDMGMLLDRLGIAVRTGHHCAQPLMHALGIEGTVRASFSFYNTKEEIDTFIAGVERVRKMF